MLRPCVGCGEPVDTARCRACIRPRLARPTTAQRGYGSRWQALSRRARKLQPWCTWCEATTDLTTDHLSWPAHSLSDVQVLCRSCNATKVLRPSLAHLRSDA